jgi:hypothetical protein
MPHQGFEDGLYLLKQKAPEKGVDHYGILDVGNRMQLPNVPEHEAVVVHQTPPKARADWLRQTGAWEVLGRVTDERFALARVRVALQTPNYNLFGNNCEHFARFIATGKRESTQVQGAVVMAGLAALTIAAFTAKDR